MGRLKKANFKRNHLNLLDKIFNIEEKCFLTTMRKHTQSKYLEMSLIFDGIIIKITSKNLENRKLSQQAYLTES